jgi:hypothetical protein
MKLTVGVRRFPPPGTVEEEAACSIVRDYNDLAAKLRDGARKDDA